MLTYYKKYIQSITPTSRGMLTILAVLLIPIIMDAVVSAFIPSHLSFTIAQKLKQYYGICILLYIAYVFSVLLDEFFLQNSKHKH